MTNYIAISEQLLWKEQEGIAVLNIKEIQSLQVLQKQYSFLVVEETDIASSIKNTLYNQLVDFGLPLKKYNETQFLFPKSSLKDLEEAEKPIAIVSTDKAFATLADECKIPLLQLQEAITNFILIDTTEKVKRTASISRNTLETKINIELNLDGTGQGTIDTGLHFFDHMLHQLVRHGNIDLSIKVDGDLEVDEHHTIEDTALALGTAFLEALGNKMGIERYGFLLPMDDCLAQVAIDFGGRPWLVWDATFNREKVGDMPTEMFLHFFKSFSDAAKCNLNIKAEGSNEHHKIESIFKAFAKAIKMAIKSDGSSILPTTKGTL